MKIVYLGQLGRGSTADMRADALERLGHEVTRIDTGALWSSAGVLRRKWERYRERGSVVRALNAAVLGETRALRPDVLWADKQRYIEPRTLRLVSRLGVRTVHYDPDPYFTLEWKRTSLADACLRLYDVLVVTKSYELDAYREHASGEVLYSPLGYDPLRHAPHADTRSIPAAWRSDLAFVGGWEPRRERLLVQARRKGLTVRIWGYGWNLALRTRVDPSRAVRLGPLTPEPGPYLGAPPKELRDCLGAGGGAAGEIYEEEYARAIAGSGVAAGFLREVWPDQHTTRSFEIPSMGGFLLADRTEEHRAFFEEGREAEFFAGAEEFIDKLCFYVGADGARGRIARAGRERCVRSGYSYDERLASVFRDARMLRDEPMSVAAG